VLIGLLSADHYFFITGLLIARILLPHHPLSTMQPGTYSPDDLPQLARTAHESTGLTQTAAAERLGVTQSAYAQALSKRAGMDALRRRIVDELTDYTLTGPVYTLARK
jgi:hypothetical protein